MKKQDTGHRARWMFAFDNALIALSPEHAGRINWDAAVFHFNQGKTPSEAAAVVAASEAPIERNF